ncbi:MAG TPA: (2Fe-2S)-binding protein, partial [Rhodothermales bacterium]|nr:(2Fe-2S)-binding protein [Rhodothermales bacterium]
LLTKLAAAVGGEVVGYIPHVVEGAGDDWLITDDKTPNAQGCERLGMQPVDAALFRARLAQAGAFYVLEDDPVAAGLCSVEDLAGVSVVLHTYHTTNRTLDAAAVVLPAAMVVETVGTYVNIDGHAQRVVPAKAIRGVNRTLMMAMGSTRADQHGTPFDRWHNEEHKVDCRPSWETLPEVASRLGHAMIYKGPKQIMAELSSQNAAFEGATYDAMGLGGVRLAEIGAAVG